MARAPKAAPPPPTRAYTIHHTTTGMGRTRSRVECACGYMNYIYHWSWAGNGSYACRGCNARLLSPWSHAADGVAPVFTPITRG